MERISGILGSCRRLNSLIQALPIGFIERQWRTGGAYIGSGRDFPGEYAILEFPESGPPLRDFLGGHRGCMLTKILAVAVELFGIIFCGERSYINARWK
jgi:hypothetical protein